MRGRLAAAFATYWNRRMLTLLALGFSSGLPAPLVFSNLSIWLRDEGVSRTSIGLFALAATPYAINFLWAPLIDRLHLPGLTTRFGRRRGWALATQFALMGAILWMSFSAPAQHLWMMAVATLLVTTASATQDIVIDAYRIDVLEPEQYGAGSAVAIWGWHLGGTLVGGAGGLLLAQYFGWQASYQVLALAVLVGIVAILCSPEPTRGVPAALAAEEDAVRVRFAGRMPARAAALAAWLYNAVVAPFAEFMRRDGWVLVLVFVFVFKFGDAMLGRMSGVFYRELGFSLADIAEVSKLYGFAANLVGVFLGGVLAARIGVLRALFVAGLMAAGTNLTYAALAMVGQQKWMLAVAVVSDSFTGGLVTVAFVAYLSGLCNVAYTATQYALLSSLGNLSRIWLSASAGYMVDRLDGDWAVFFFITAGLALLGLPLLVWLMRRFPAHVGQAARAGNASA
ncbi:AmpG family muropeptide MFS transporter [Pseudothauera nasutitermitis]|uniref:AmpG family muropeptide MFS transporter n=1 Tax=Pseudothauera nasutitermitis TaxID=2565930 RepID=A0A4S4AM52_9RHOO|nr:MFS transporter [Pseudothauera nasutitermitis]THF60564.1 AmpG family muropeptide MFS transporter [Pseudothauera nasutitermitis]